MPTMIKWPKYGLYYTLNNPSSIPKKNLTKKEEKVLQTQINKLDKNRKKAIICLIYEHALSTKVIEYTHDKVELPYGIYDDKKNEYVIQLSELPIPLKWILTKFLQIGSTNLESE